MVGERGEEGMIRKHIHNCTAVHKSQRCDASHGIVTEKKGQERPMGIDCTVEKVGIESRWYYLNPLLPKGNNGGTAVTISVHVHELYFCCNYIIWGKGSMGSSGT